MNRQNALKKKSVEMSKSSALGENKEKLVNLGHDIEELNNTYEITEDPPLNSDEYIDWMRVSDVFLKDKHSAFECKSIWHIYLHPHQQVQMDPSENAKLKDLAKNLNYQNWDQIAH
ncbi:hypothetical protein NQ318_004351 [Aromia moschata]|uniref:Uncharacterized protein n=1 Tax=Aromia moschata TaxID=1265417 RepID=A0AAV8YQ37_9CUCU|nr:hypothetical protein NQ318_004351 [Aromia moschata]